MLSSTLLISVICLIFSRYIESVFDKLSIVKITSSTDKLFPSDHFIEVSIFIKYLFSAVFAQSFTKHFSSLYSLVS